MTSILDNLTTFESIFILLVPCLLSSLVVLDRAYFLQERFIYLTTLSRCFERDFDGAVK